MSGRDARRGERAVPFSPPSLACAWLESENASSSAAHPAALKSKEFPVPVFYINMAESTARRAYMEGLLDRVGPLMGLGKVTRIEAITPESPLYNISLLEQPCKRNVPRDLAVIASHLTAMHRAVYDPSNSRSPYALILEDDISLPLHINFHSLIATAPAGFGILQLTTSSREGLNIAWRHFTDSVGRDLWTLNHWGNTTRDGRYPLFWSAQGYLISKAVVKDFLDDVIDTYTNKTVAGASTTCLSFKLVNSFFPQRCKRTRARPCILSNCLFSDSYIYAGGGPTYVSNVPVLNGGAIGKTSTVHQEHVERVHLPVFDSIRAMTDALKKDWEEKSGHGSGGPGSTSHHGARGLGPGAAIHLGGASLPSYVVPPTCPKHPLAI